jgi:hypothetical protein
MYRGVQKKRELASEYVFGGASVQKKLLEGGNER